MYIRAYDDPDQFSNLADFAADNRALSQEKGLFEVA